MKRILKTIICLCLLLPQVKGQQTAATAVADNDSLYRYTRDLMDVDIHEGLDYTRKLTAQARRNNDSSLLSQALLLQAQAQLKLQHYSQAENLMYQALSLATTDRDSSLKARANYLCGAYRYQQGDPFQALSYLKKALKYASSAPVEVAVMTHYYLAEIYLQLDQLSTAGSHVSEVESLVRGRNLDRYRGLMLNLRGEMELSHGNFDRARSYLQNAIIANRKMGNMEQVAHSYDLLATNWERLGIDQEAYANARKAVESISKTSAREENVKLLVRYSQMARQHRDDSLALKMALRADSLATSFKAFAPLQKEVSQQLAKLYLAAGDSALALRHLLKVENISDSLRMSNLREMILERENREARTQLRELHNQNLEHEVTISRSKLLLLAAAAAIVVISLLLLVLWRSSLRTKHYSNHLLTKNKEINSQKKQLQEQQEELLAKNQQLEELDKNKNKVFSVLSHDLRQPINQIRSVLDLIESEDLTAEERKQVVLSMRQSLDNSSNALENLLLWSKNQLTGISTRVVDVHLLPQVWQMESHLKPNLETKNLKLHIDVPDFFKVQADMNQLDICLKNLVNNAIKFSNNGGTITIKAYAKGDKKYIEVKDEGVGMTPDQLAKLRKLNGNFSTLGTMNEKGTGLGIMITREFMQNQHGELEVDSVQGKGSTFSMVFPNVEGRKREHGSLRKI